MVILGFLLWSIWRDARLRELLKSVKVLSPGEASFIALEVIKTLNYVHSKDIVHNDVKTDNILFRHKLEKGAIFEPVLIDFGIAAKSKKIQEDAGALPWMSPERLNSAKKRIASRG